jgi:hypothetical protein
MVLLLILASFSLFLTYMAWAPVACYLYICKRLSVPAPERTYGYCRVLKWPALAGIISFWATDVLVQHVRIPSDVFFFALFLGFWFFFRNAGDNNNRKKKKEPRVRARLQQVGGRLVVVPERLA